MLDGVCHVDSHPYILHKYLLFIVNIFVSLQFRLLIPPPARIASIEWVTERDVRASEVGLPNASLWWMYRELPQVLLVAVEDLQELLGIAAFVDGGQRGLLLA